MEQCQEERSFWTRDGEYVPPLQAKLLKSSEKVSKMERKERSKSISDSSCHEQDLEERFSGNFAKTFTTRLNVGLYVFPFAGKKEDIPERHLIRQEFGRVKKNVIRIVHRLEKITSYGWPGNVRQLENVLKRAMVLCQGEWILEDQLLFERAVEKWEAGDLSKKPVEDLLDILFEELSKTQVSSQDLDMISVLERGMILRALQKTQGNQVRQPRFLGISEDTLQQNGKISY
jgi:DNA-binding NtrC family response regulator